MDRPKKLIQAYRQAPWRRQLQIIGLFSATVVFVALVAGVYLNVTARAATIGRRIQEMQNDREVTQQTIEDLESQLARLTSAAVMEARAEKLGFVPVEKDNIMYLEVDGYLGRQPASLAPGPGNAPEAAPSLPSEFTLSLIDWGREMVSQLALQNGVSLEELRP